MAAKMNCNRQEVRGPDGRIFTSMRQAARTVGCSAPALYSYAEWRGGIIHLTRYPDPRNTGRHGGAKTRTRQ